MDLNPKLYVLEEFGHGLNYVLQQRKTKCNPPGREWENKWLILSWLDLAELTLQLAQMIS